MTRPGSKQMKFGVAALATVALVIGLSVGLTGNNRDTTNALSASQAQSAGSFNFDTDCPDLLLQHSGKSGKSGSGKSGKSGSMPSGSKSSGSKSGRRLGHPGRGESCFRLNLRTKIFLFHLYAPFLI